jgi:hypothetical protein
MLDSVAYYLRARTSIIDEPRSVYWMLHVSSAWWISLNNIDSPPSEFGTIKHSNSCVYWMAYIKYFRARFLTTLFSHWKNESETGWSLAALIIKFLWKLDED